MLTTDLLTKLSVNVCSPDIAKPPPGITEHTQTRMSALNQERTYLTIIQSSSTTCMDSRINSARGGQEDKVVASELEDLEFGSSNRRSTPPSPWIAHCEVVDSWILRNTPVCRRGKMVLNMSSLSLFF